MWEKERQLGSSEDRQPLLLVHSSPLLPWVETSSVAEWAFFASLVVTGEWWSLAG